MIRDEYEGQLSVNVGFMMNKAAKHSSESGDRKVQGIGMAPYEGLVYMSGNITSHVTVRCLTDRKWKLYGNWYFYCRFFFFLFFTVYWTIFYALPPDRMTGWSGGRSLGWFLMVFGVLLLIFSLTNLIHTIKQSMKRGTKLVNMARARENFERTTYNHLTQKYSEKVSIQHTKVSALVKKKLSHRLINLVLILVHLILMVQCIVKGERMISGKDLENKTGYIGKTKSKFIFDIHDIIMCLK